MSFIVILFFFFPASSSPSACFLLLSLSSSSCQSSSCLFFSAFLFSSSVFVSASSFSDFIFFFFLFLLSSPTTSFSFFSDSLLVSISPLFLLVFYRSVVLQLCYFPLSFLQSSFLLLLSVLFVIVVVRRLLLYCLSTARRLIIRPECHLWLFLAVVYRPAIGPAVVGHRSSRCRSGAATDRPCLSVFSSLSGRQAATLFLLFGLFPVPSIVRPPIRSIDVHPPALRLLRLLFGCSDRFLVGCPVVRVLSVIRLLSAHWLFLATVHRPVRLLSGHRFLSAATASVDAVWPLRPLF